MVRLLIIIPFIITLVSCNQKNDSKKSDGNVKDRNENDFTISEKFLQNLPLPLPRDISLDSINSALNPISVSKEVGTQDGPNFPLYDLKLDGNSIAFIAMDDVDTLSTFSVVISSAFTDEYGIKVNDPLSKIITNRDSGKITFDPYHFHIYYGYPNSNIYYELEGELHTPAVEDFEEIQISINDIKDHTVQHIIWRKK